MKELIKWDKLRVAIETAKDIKILSQLRDKIKAYQILAEQSKQSWEVQSKITVYRARIDWKLGEWLKENVKQGQRSDLSHNVTSLKDVNITKMQSSRLQKIADIPEDKFEGILQEAEQEVKRVTQNMLINVWYR